MRDKLEQINDRLCHINLNLRSLDDVEEENILNNMDILLRMHKDIVASQTFLFEIIKESYK